MPKTTNTPPAGPRIVVCESDECTPRSTKPEPHVVSADCKHPRTVKGGDR